VLSDLVVKGSKDFVTYGLVGSVFFVIGSLIGINLIKDFLD